MEREDLEEAIRKIAEDPKGRQAIDRLPPEMTRQLEEAGLLQNETEFEHDPYGL